jgi:hypothetical protein
LQVWELDVLLEKLVFNEDNDNDELQDMLEEWQENELDVLLETLEVELSLEDVVLGMLEVILE